MARVERESSIGSVSRKILPNLDSAVNQSEISNSSFPDSCDKELCQPKHGYMCLDMNVRDTAMV